VGVIVGTDFGNDPLALLLIMLSFVIAISALTFALATQVQNESQANGVALLLSLTLAPLGGAWWPLEITPDFMQVIGHISPVAWAMDGFREIIFYGGTLPDVLVPIGVLLAIAAVLFGIGVAGFRYEM
jgi:ABC-2 type transport system permease protein